MLPRICCRIPNSISIIHQQWSKTRMKAINILKDWFREKVGQVAAATTFPSKGPSGLPAPVKPVQPVLTEEQLSELSPEAVLRYRMGMPASERIDTYRSLGKDGVPTAPFLERKRLADVSRDFNQKWGDHIQLDARVGAPDKTPPPPVEDTGHPAGQKARQDFHKRTGIGLA
jgi:hypothetical protein